jgi:hypothetical protein
MKKTRDLQSTEAFRQLRQNEVDLSKSQKDRNKLGQFSTPRILADELLEYAQRSLASKDVRFLDPAFGVGSFYTALLKSFGPKHRALGFEIDPEYYKAAKEVWEDYRNLDLRKSDFIREPVKDYERANLLVCNPPYVRHQHLSSETKSHLKTMTKEVSGKEISGLAGLHAYFMLLCHQWLDQNGLAIWLVPSEITEVNYGKTIREYLTDKVNLERIHFFEHSDVQFEDALVSSCVIVYRKSEPSMHTVQITTGTSFARPDSVFDISKGDLRRKNKWSKHILQSKPVADISVSPEKKLGDLFTIKRGIATGDNNFFVLSKEQAMALEIPKKYLRNVLPPSRYLKGDVVRLDEDGFLDTKKKLVLLDVDLSMDQIQTQYPKLYKYLKEGMDKGVHLGYLTSRRGPWYSQEKRNTPSFFVRYMNRESKDQKTHHSIFIKNETDAIATNSYLMLYQKPSGLFAPLAVDIWSFLRKGLDKTLYRYGRTYGGGLVKFEPNELREIPITV